MPLTVKDKQTDKQLGGRGGGYIPETSLERVLLFFRTLFVASTKL